MVADNATKLEVLDRTNTGVTNLLKDTSLHTRRQNDNLEILARAANTDVLTGLLNRRSFTERLEEAIIDQKPITVLMLDLDGFKSLNDASGHAAGDEVLKETAKRLQGAMRENDIVARFGGDEFVIMVECDDVQILTDISNRIIKAIGESYTINLPNRLLRFNQPSSQDIGISIGIAIKTDGENAEKLLEIADGAVRQAKNAGKNRAEFANKLEFERLQEVRKKLNHLLRTPKGHSRKSAGKIPMHCEQIYDLSGQPVPANMMEILMRLRFADSQLIAPETIISTASSMGDMEQVGRLVLSSAAKEILTWQEDPKHPNTRGHINLSSAECTPKLADRLKKILQQTRLSANSIGLEISVDTFTSNMKQTVATLEELQRQFGTDVAVWIDQMGIPQQVGRSGEGIVLPIFPNFHIPDIISGFKISRQAIANIDINVEKRKYLTAFLRLLEAFELPVIGVGLETKDQIKIIQDLGVKYGQGYAFDQK